MKIVSDVSTLSAAVTLVLGMFSKKPLDIHKTHRFCRLEVQVWNRFISFFSLNIHCSGSIFMKI